MRIMEWNIRHGGSRDRLPGIMASLRHHDPDIICFIEFRQERIIELSLSLAKNGWPYVLSSQPPQNTNGILVASKRAIEPIPNRLTGYANLWLEVRPARSDLRILALQVPSVQDLNARMEFWRMIKEFAERAVQERSRSVILGDLNTGLEGDSEGPSYLGDDDLRSVLRTGWRDVWREYHQSAREYSWYNSQGKGYRLDHALVSPDIDRPVWASYSHQERADGVSDHSPLILSISDRLTEAGSIKSALR